MGQPMDATMYQQQMQQNMMNQQAAQAAPQQAAPAAAPTQAAPENGWTCACGRRRRSPWPCCAPPSATASPAGRRLALPCPGCDPGRPPSCSPARPRERPAHPHWRPARWCPMRSRPPSPCPTGRGKGPPRPPWASSSRCWSCACVDAPTVRALRPRPQCRQRRIATGIPHLREAVQAATQSASAGSLRKPRHCAAPQRHGIGSMSPRTW